MNSFGKCAVPPLNRAHAVLLELVLLACHRNACRRFVHEVVYAHQASTVVQLTVISAGLVSNIKLPCESAGRVVFCRLHFAVHVACFVVAGTTLLSSL